MRNDIFIWAAITVIVILVGASIFILMTHSKSPTVSKTESVPETSTTPEKANPIVPKEETLPPIQYCPNALGIFYYVDNNKTAWLSDDTVYISIKNPDFHEYKGEVIVGDAIEGNVVLISNSTTKIGSGAITRWWRSGLTTSSDGQQENSSFFKIKVLINGCNQAVSTMSPSMPGPDDSEPGGGGGGSGGGGGAEAGFIIPRPEKIWNIID
jgi:hypothetical protein